MKFIRFGSLKATKYNHYDVDNPTFHAPPVRRGIYAFPFGYDESFLWAWKVPRKEDDSEEEWEKRYQTYRKANRKEFEYEGPIWCHFTEEVKCGTVVNSWVLTDMKTYEEALKKDRHEQIKSLQKMHASEVWGSGEIDETCRIINPYKRGLNTFLTTSRDHLEVFIQKKDLGKIK